MLKKIAGRLIRYYVFSYFLKVIDKLQTNSYTFFFNANAVIVKEIPFSTFMESDLIGVIHPGYKNRISIPASAKDKSLF